MVRKQDVKMVQIPQRKLETEIRFNARTKLYPNGSTKSIVCNRAIFRDPNYVRVHTKKQKESPPAEPNAKLQEFLKDCIAMGVTVRFITTAEPKPDSDPAPAPAPDRGDRDDNLKRTKEKVFDIAMLNKFEYFVTWTLDKEKIDRYDPKVVSKKLSKFLNNMVSRYDLKYLVIPEHHKDGAIHMHGLISGNFHLVDSNRKTKSGKIIYNMPGWSWGHSTAIETYGENENISKYITKYLTKDFRKIFGKYYYSGGDIIRDAPIILDNWDYDQLPYKEYSIPSINRKFKYIDKPGKSA